MSFEWAMEAKAKQDGGKAESSKRRITSYFREFKEELRKVSWTTKQELKFFTKIVIGSTFLFGFGIYVVDLLMKGALDGLAVLGRFIFG